MSDSQATAERPTDELAEVWDAAYRRGIDDILRGESKTPAPNPYRPAK